MPPLLDYDAVPDNHIDVAEGAELEMQEEDWQEDEGADGGAAGA